MRRYFVYILSNRRYGVLCVGLTNDLHRRMFQHRSKVVPGFTQEHGVIRLVYFEEYASITETRTGTQLEAVASRLEARTRR